MLGEGAHGSLLQSFIAYLLRLSIGFLALVFGGNVLIFDYLQGIFVDPFVCFFFIIKSCRNYSSIMHELHFG